MSDPEPVSQIEQRLHVNEGFYRTMRLVWTIIICQAVLIVTLAVVSGLLGYQRLTERARIDSDVTRIVSSQCAFYVPLVVAGNQLTLKTGSRLGTEIVEGSRQAIHGLGCSYRLPPPTRTLLQLGRKYGIQFTY